MSDDLVSLRVLVFGLTGAERDLLRQGAALASLPLEFEEASTAGRAAAFLERGNIDLVLLDALSSDADQASVIKAARAATRQPFVILVGGDKQAVGPDALVKLPGSEEEARQNSRLLRAGQASLPRPDRGQFKDHARHRSQNSWRQPVRHDHHRGR